MALSRDDYGELVRHFLAALRERDPLMFERLMKSEWHSESPRGRC